ncbi:MAG: glycerophosphodiester phosphodiesterase family protein [Clostridia bacterium]|nr:glycerophosphodiester phosphodiesterase family protein [Clostridia bacterium]
MEFLIGEKIAHRGLHNEKIGIYENTIEAFKKAIYNKLSIELDVRITKDRKLVVFHDNTLERLVGINKKVRGLNLEEIKKFHLKNSDSRIPTLEEVFEVVDNRVSILIEVKTNNNIFKTYCSLKKTISNYNGRIALQSFDPLLLILIRFGLRGIYRGQISSYYRDSSMSKIKKYILKNMLFNLITKPHFIGYNIEDMPNKRVSNVRKKGVYVFGWTIRKKEEYQKVKNYCDSFIFENEVLLNIIK